MPKVMQLLVVPPPSDRYDAELVALLDDGTAQVCQYHAATLKWNPLPLPGDVTPAPWTKIFGAMPDLPDTGEPPNGEARIYPCADCGLMRSRAEGGTTFTVCDGCWDKHYKKHETAPPAQAATEVKHERVNVTSEHNQARSLVASLLGQADQRTIERLDRYIDQQSRREQEAADTLSAVRSNLGERARTAEKEMELARRELRNSRDAAAQAAPRVEGGLLRERACRLLGEDCRGLHTDDCDRWTALLADVDAQARASALPPGAAEALREWRALPQNGRDIGPRDVVAYLLGEDGDMQWRRAYGTAARLLRALASGADGES